MKPHFIVTQLDRHYDFITGFIFGCGASAAVYYYFGYLL